MENRQNKPPKGGAASGHGGQKFHTDSEQAKLHKSKLRMESREGRLNKARERLAKQKPPKKPGPIKRIARIAGHETHAFADKPSGVGINQIPKPTMTAISSPCHLKPSLTSTAGILLSIG